MRTYYCEDCEKCVDIDMSLCPQCKCGKVFGNSFKTSNYVNMRNTWSGTTKVEFSQTTIDEDIAQRNKR